MAEDRARGAALRAMKAIRAGGYANIAVDQILARTQMSWRDAAFVTQLVYGTCRNMGTLDLIIEAASGRALDSLQPGVVDVLRLGTQQLLRMRVPDHAAVSSSVSLAADHIGPRVKGVVNAILHKVALHDWEGWVTQITVSMDPHDALGVRYCHPRWIVDAYALVLPPEELVSALEADNTDPVPTLAIRPGLITRDELLTEGGEPTLYSPWGVIREGDPGQVTAVRDGRAGVQDEGSQLVAGVLALVDSVRGPWLDMCAGPGGKAALLTGLAAQRGEQVVSSDLHAHRAELVAKALRAYGHAPVLVADGLRPAWNRSFSRVLLDAPCTGLGALRRRPEARWRKHADDVDSLADLQARLLDQAIASTVPGGVVAYVTCSWHPRETVDVIAKARGVEQLDAPSLLPAVPDARSTLDAKSIQLWGHRHNVDSMFCALLRVL